jgi:hypothetical protein
MARPAGNLTGARRPGRPRGSGGQPPRAGDFIYRIYIRELLPSRARIEHTKSPPADPARSGTPPIPRGPGPGGIHRQARPVPGHRHRPASRRGPVMAPGLGWWSARPLARARDGAPERTCVLMEKASQRVRQYVLISSMFQLTQPDRWRSDAAPADAEGAFGAASDRVAAPGAARFGGPHLASGRVRVARAPGRPVPAGPRLRAAGGMTAATGPPARSPRPPGRRRGGRRRAGRRAAGPPVTARTPC